MADQTEKILLELRLNADQLKQELGGVRDRTRELRAENKQTQASLDLLAAAGQKGTKVYADLLTQLGANERALVGLGREAQQLNKNLDAVESAAGSYNELAASTAFLEKQLKEATRGVTLSAEAYDDLSERVSAGYAAQRDFARNQSNNARELVGAYKEELGPAIDGVTAEIKVANNSIVAMREQIAALKQTRDVLDPTTKEAKDLTSQIEELNGKIKEAQTSFEAIPSGPLFLDQAVAAAGSLAAMRKELDELTKKREFAAPEEVGKLSNQILGLKTNILEAEGKIDEFGDKIERNAKREDIATLGDAFGGVSAAINVATLLLGDNENATAAAAAATKALAVAESIRQIQIGIASAGDAASIVITKAKSFFVRDAALAETQATVATEAHVVAVAEATVAVAAEGAAAGAAAVATTVHTEAIVADTLAVEGAALAEGALAETTAASAAASTAAAVASTEAAGATVGQAAAAEGATVAQTALNTAMRLNPIGLIITALVVLVGAFLAYGNASDKTKAKLDAFFEAILRYTNPVGLLYTAIEKLYQKFEVVRTVLDPMLEGFEKVFSVIKTEARELGQAIGLIDTAAEAALKAKEKLATAVADRAGLFEAEAKQLELAGRKLEEYRAKERAGIVASYNAERDVLNALRALKAEKEADGEKLDAAALKRLTEQALKVRTLANELGTYDKETTAQRLQLQQQELNNRASMVDAQLELVRTGSLQELTLTKQRLALQRAAELSVAELTASDKKAIEAKYRADVRQADREYAQNSRAAALQNRADSIATRLETVRLGSKQELELERAALKVARDQKLNDYNLSAAERKQINARYKVDELTLEVNYARQAAQTSLEAERSRLNAELALVAKGSQDEYELKRAQITLEQELELAALDRTRGNEEANAARRIEIRANMNAKLAELDSQNLAAANARRQREADDEKAAIDAGLALMSAGLSEGQRKQLEASRAYQNTRRESVFAGAAAELQAINAAAAEQLLAAGSNVAQREQIEAEAARKRVLLEKATAAELLQIDADTNAKRRELLQEKIEVVASLTLQALDSLSSITDAQLNGELASIESKQRAEVASVGDNEAQKKVIRDKYARQAERAEAEAAEKRRKIQIAQALVNAGLAITQILAAPAAPFVEPFATIVRAAQIGLVVATTATQIANMKSQKFAEGGVVSGPTHAAGGIQLIHKTGAHVGEMEGDETILAPGVARSPILRRLASALNVLGGGRAFAGGFTSATAGSLAKFAAGGVVKYDPQALANGRSGGSQLQAPAINYTELAAALAPVLTSAVGAMPAPQLVVSEFNEVQRRVIYTESQANN